MTLLLSAALFVLLQVPLPTQPAQQPPKASIEGFVVRAGTNEPISNARITVSRGPVAPTAPVVALATIPGVTTDSQGRFSVKDLDPGTYVVSALRNGFARQQYGERAPGRPGTPLNIVAGRAVKDIVFRLIPAGTVSGRVSDATGEPIAGITVQVVRSIYDGQGRRTFQPVGTARTDDRGEYRVYWVTPGRYYVTAGPNRLPVDVVLVGANSNEYVEPGYVLTYYPGTTDLSSAAAIEIQPGAELTTIDFRLRQQQLYRVRGRVFDARTGQFPRSAGVSLAPRTPNTATLYSAGTNYNAATGTFELRDVAPGSYWLRAIATEPSGSFSAAEMMRSIAQAAIEVGNADVENIVLSFTQGFSLRGRIEMEDGSPLPNPERTRVMLVPSEPAPIFAPPPILQPDGNFILQNIPPGDYRISITPMPPNTYIKSARVGQVDVLSGISISGPLSDGFFIVVGMKPGEIAGTIVDKDQKPMGGILGVLIPDRQRDRRDLYRTATSDQNGQFTFRNVVPGEYKLFAWEDLEPFAYNDPEFLRRYEDRGSPVRVAESSKLTVEARIIPAGQ